MKNEEESKQEEKVDYSGSKEKSLAKIGEDLLTRLFSAIKTGQIYEPNNLTFLEQVNLFFSLINETLKNEGEALLQFKENTLFFNTYRIKINFSTYQSFKFLTDELIKKEIGTISFGTGLNENELKEFILLLSKAEPKKENPFEDVQTQLNSAGITHISLEKMHPFEMMTQQDEKQVKKYAKKVFFKSMTHLKEVFERQKQEKRVRLKTTRRLMQSTVNLIIQNEPFMVGLTNLKNYDEYTLNHSINVCVLSISLGRRLGLDKKELVDLGIAAFFHDIGKLDIPKEILNKPGKLSDEERQIIEKHPHIGAGKLVHFREFSYLPVRSLYVALEHHLRADLTGYPKYWKKDSINLFSKIVEICDFFDALTTKRPYRQNTFTRIDVLNMMLEKSGIDFDPLVLKVFSNMVGAYPIGSLVALDTGELSIVEETNPEVAFILRPKIKIIADERGNKLDGEIVDLAEKDSDTDEYTRTIVKTLDPDKYNINVADYFLAEGEETSAEL